MKALPAQLFLVAALAGGSGVSALTPALAHGAEPSAPGLVADSDSARRSVLLLDYVAIDYPRAVVDGRVVSESELAEQAAFVAQVRSRLLGLGLAEQDPLLVGADGLRDAIDVKAAAADVCARATALARAVEGRFSVAALPAGTASLADGHRLFAEHCARCHGEEGRGDGPDARGLIPAVGDLTDRERMAALPASTLFNAVTFGIDATAMAGFAATLGEVERRDVAAYAGLLAFDGSELEKAAALVGESWDAVLGSDLGRAQHLAQTAYLDGYAAVADAIAARDYEVGAETEEAFQAYRHTVGLGARGKELDAAYARLVVALGRARSAAAAPPRPRPVSGTALLSGVAGVAALLVWLQSRRRRVSRAARTA